jgi:hypothetical protein
MSFEEENIEKNVEKNVEEDSDEEDVFMKNLTMRCLCNQNYIAQLNRDINKDDDEMDKLMMDVLVHEPEIIDIFFSLLRNSSDIGDQYLHTTFTAFIKQTIQYIKLHKIVEESGEESGEEDDI